MMKIWIFIFFGFFPVALNAVSEETENLQKITLRYLDEAWKAGLSSPYERSPWFSTKTWPEKYVKELDNYISFYHGFQYLFQWCDFDFENTISSYSKTTQEYIAQEWPQETIAKRHQHIQKLRAQQPKVQNILHTGWAEIHQHFKPATANWKTSKNTIDLFQAGLFYFEEGKTAEAIFLIEKIIDSGQLQELFEHLQIKLQQFYVDLAISYSEVGLYEQAINILNTLIQEKPKCKEAYLQRAMAYFELGNFNVALEDYLSSNIKSIPYSEDNKSSLDFSLGVVKGILIGSRQGVVEFIPSLLSSANGIGHGLWAFASDPLNVSADFIKNIQNIIEYLRSNTSKEVLLNLVPELNDLIKNWDHLIDSERGEISGHIIGKYGVDIFACTGAIKAVKYYRNFKRTNNLLTLEAMALGENNKRLIHLEAIKHAEKRKQLLQHANIKIQWEKQGKHIVGHKNFNSKLNKSILEHPKPQKLIDDFTGKGLRIGNKQPGMPGFQEIVDFKEYIGYSVDRNTGEKILTSWGKIHYSKNGVHIVPTRPRG